MRFWIALALLSHAAIVRGEPAFMIFGGPSSLTGSQGSITDLGLEFGAGVCWRNVYRRLAWEPEIAVAYDRWDSRYGARSVVTAAPGIRAGFSAGAWTPGLAWRLGFIHTSGDLLPGAGNAFMIELVPSIDFALTAHLTLRAEFAFHAAMFEGSMIWLTFGPSLVVGL